MNHFIPGREGFLVDKAGVIRNHFDRSPTTRDLLIKKIKLTIIIFAHALRKHRHVVTELIEQALWMT
jgi:hypothetical protein